MANMWKLEKNTYTPPPQSTQTLRMSFIIQSSLRYGHLLHNRAEDNIIFSYQGKGEQRFCCINILYDCNNDCNENCNVDNNENCNDDCNTRAGRRPTSWGRRAPCVHRQVIFQFDFILKTKKLLFFKTKKLLLFKKKQDLTKSHWSKTDADVDDF